MNHPHLFDRVIGLFPFAILSVELVELIPLMSDLLKLVIQSSIGVVSFLYIYRKYRLLKSNNKQNE